jgi:hypothetical protein
MSVEKRRQKGPRRFVTFCREERRRQEGLRFVRFCRDLSHSLYGVLHGEEAAVDYKIRYLIDSEFFVIVSSYTCPGGWSLGETHYLLYPDHEEALILTMWRSLSFHYEYLDEYHDMSSSSSSRFADSTGIPFPLENENSFFKAQHPRR